MASEEALGSIELVSSFCSCWELQRHAQAGPGVIKSRFHSMHIGSLLL
jgi:hypothetical protein